MGLEMPAELIERDAKAALVEKRAPTPIECGSGRAAAQKQAYQAEPQPPAGIKRAGQNGEGVVTGSSQSCGSGEIARQAKIITPFASSIDYPRWGIVQEFARVPNSQAIQHGSDTR